MKTKIILALMALLLLCLILFWPDMAHAWQVKEVSRGSQGLADFKYVEVTQRGFADVFIYKTSSTSEAQDSPYHWKWTSSGGTHVLKIYEVPSNNEVAADCKVFFVTSKSSVGVRPGKHCDIGLPSSGIYYQLYWRPQMLITNASNPNLAGVLSELGDSGQGNLVSLIVRKKGVERGKAGSKVQYDNERVHILLWTGFQYQSLVERSSRKLDELTAKSSHFLQDLAQATIAAGQPNTTIKDASEALQEIEDHFRHVLEGSPDSFDGNTPTDLPASIWEPLQVDGHFVKGAKVYIGLARPEDPRAPQPGSIYLDGVKLGEKVLEAAPHWEANQKPKSVAKNIIRSWLPVGHYVRYNLGPEALSGLKVGKAASEAAKAAGVVVDPDKIRLLFKIA